MVSNETHELLGRIAVALERLGDILEKSQSTGVPPHIAVDGRALARAVISHTLKQTTRGPSGLVGGSLRTEQTNGDG